MMTKAAACSEVESEHIRVVVPIRVESLGLLLPRTLPLGLSFDSRRRI